MIVNAFEIYDYLPEKIKELLFSQFMDNLMANIFALANIPEEKQISLHRDTVGVLIGRHDLKQYENILKTNYGLNDNVTATTIALLNEKLFNQITDALEKSKEVYKRFSEGNIKNLSNSVISETKNEFKEPEKIMSYIQELAESIKKEDTLPEANLEIIPTIADMKIIPEEKKITINTPVLKPEEAKVEPVVIKNEAVAEEPVKEVAPEVKPVEEVPAFVPKESTVFKMMKNKEEQSNGKLNEYFKALKDNLDFGNTNESENIFQPPFKATKGRSMMVESSIEESKDNIVVNESIEPKKKPVRYNSFEFMKKPNTPSEAKSADDKFIDLGDF